MSSQSMNLTPIDVDYENRMVAFMIDCNDGKGEPMSCHQAGEYFAVVKEDHSKAAGIYKTNCDEKGYGASCFNYGRLLMSGKGVEANDTESEKYFAKGCDQGTGHLVSCYHQAMLMMINSEKDKNIEKKKKALVIMDNTCTNQLVEGCYFSGAYYLRQRPDSTDTYKNTPPRDPFKALQYYEKSCQQEHGPSCYNLAVMYKKGDIGIPPNDEKFQYYKQRTNELMKKFGGLGGIQTG